MVKDKALSRLRPGFKSRSEHTDKRFESFPHQLYKGGKTQGILTNIPSYLSNGVKKVKMVERVIEALPEPNKQYASWSALAPIISAFSYLVYSM